MLLNRLPKGSLLLAGLAAFAYYKYSRMTPEQKKNIADRIKSGGRKIFDQFKSHQGQNNFAHNSF